jgi:hypothetical protein
MSSLLPIQGGIPMKSKIPYVALGWRRIYARIDGQFVAVGWGRPEDWRTQDKNRSTFRIQNNPGKEGKK